MTARCYPEQVHERDGRIGEVHVWRLLRDALPDDAVLMYSVHVPVGWDGFFADEDEFYSTVSSFKGLERGLRLS